jgi:hypothetical protein
MFVRLSCGLDPAIRTSAPAHGINGGQLAGRRASRSFQMNVALYPKEPLESHIH